MVWTRLIPISCGTVQKNEYEYGSKVMHTPQGGRSTLPFAECYSEKADMEPLNLIGLSL